MKTKLILLHLIFSSNIFAQQTDIANDVWIKKLYADNSYLKQKEKISSEFAHSLPGSWGEFVKGVDEDIVTNKKITALTFDACGGPRGSGYDAELIKFLQNEKIPATLFVTGKWIDANYNTFVELSRDSLFEIENHGLNHQPCSIDGESEYGIKGTPDVPDAFDEIEANERKIEILTGKRLKFYRSATAYIDEACAKLARQLDVTAISFDVLSGDAVPKTPVSTIEQSVLSHIKPGALVIMHFNHPEWNTYEALVKIVPQLRKEGYSFARLRDYPLKGR